MILVFLYLKSQKFSKKAQKFAKEFWVKSFFTIWTSSIDVVISEIAKKIDEEFSSLNESKGIERLYTLLRERGRDLTDDSKFLQMLTDKNSTPRQKALYRLLILESDDLKQNERSQIPCPKHFDHVFAKSLLQKSGVSDQEIEDYRNKWFMPEGVNRDKSDIHPTKWYNKLPDQGGKNLNQIWANAQAIDWDYISTRDEDANIRDVYYAFLEHREDLIRKALKLGN
jgi:hypothetical protein